MEETHFIKIHLLGQEAGVKYIMKKASKMSSIKKNYSERVGVSVENLKFSFNRNSIGDEETPEILGMKTSEYVHVSFIDEDYYLMEFDPRHINDRGRVKLTYQAMLQMAELTGKLLDVLKKRIAAARERETLEIKDCVPFHGLKKNLYQLSRINREKLMKYSVEKLLIVFGSEEEIKRFRTCIFQVAKFIKMCLYNILESLLPATLPYMERLFFSLADIFTLLKALMFNTDSQWYCGSPICTLASLKKEDLLASLQALGELLESSVDGTNENGPNESST